MAEQEEVSSEWTVNTLFTYMITRLKAMEELLEERKDAQNKAMEAALAAAEKAVAKAEVATEKRFDSVNEFRQTLSDQATQFVTRTEYGLSMGAMNERLSDVKTRLDKQEGKGVGLNAGWLYLTGAVIIVGTIIGAVIAVT